LIWYAVAGLFRSRAALQTEVLALRHQLNVLRRRAPKRVALSNIDRLVFAGLYHLAPELLDAVTSSSLASAIFAMFSHLAKNTTTRSERTYHWRRTCRFGVMCAEQGACVCRHLGWATPSNMFEFAFPTGTANYRRVNIAH
jgi:hypothetical protein